MKLIKLFLLCLLGAFAASGVAGQSDAGINMLTQNSGVVNQGGTVFLEVTINSNGPTAGIPAGSVVVSIFVPSIVQIQSTGHILPPGWQDLGDFGTGGAEYYICNGSDAIPAGASRTLLIAIQGISIGGPSTISGNISLVDCDFNPVILPGDSPNNNGGTASIKVQAAPACSLGVSASAGTIACNGGTTILTATATGGNGAVEYSLNGGAFQSGNTFTVSAIGSPYTVTAREVSNPTCTATSNSVTVNDPPVVITPTINITQPTCTVATGTIAITSPTTGLTFSLDGGAYATYPSGGYTVNAGAHTLTAQNTSGCISSVTNITVNAQPATPAAPTVSVVQPTCTVVTGIITITSATAGLTFSLDGGAYALYPSGGYTVNTGLHTLTAQNTGGCISSVTNITVNAQPATPAAPTVSVVQPTCTVATGTITITSAIAGLTFSLDGGTYATYTSGGYTVNAGAHTLTAQNANGCISSVTNITVNAQPVTPVSPIVGSITQPTCAISTGSVVLNALPSGNWTINPGVITGNTTTATINGLAQGSYNFTVTNSVGCTSSASANVIINSVPGAPAAAIVNVVHPTCTVTTGTITITSSTSGLTFSLDGGAYVTYPVGGYVVATGSHIITARNAALCTSPVTNITVNAQPATPTAPTVSVVQPTCTVATGTIIVTSSTTGLTFSLDGGSYVSYPTGGYTVASGSHTLTVQNTSGCISSVTNITVNAQPTIPVSPIVNSITQPTCVVLTGSVVLSGLPAGNWTLTRSPGNIITTGNTATVSVNNLVPGTYNFTVTNSFGCTSVLSVDVIITAVAGTPSAPTVNIVQPTCTVATGVITVTSLTTGLMFSLDGGTYVVYPVGGYVLAAGSHTITTRNAALCTSPVTNITVNTQPATPSAPIVNMVQPTCTVATGTIAVTSSTSGLTFSLDGGAYTSYPSGGYTVNAGAHTLTAQNISGGCISSVTNITVNAQPTTPAAPTASVVQPTCTLATGTITVISSTTGLTFSLDGGSYVSYPTGGYIVASGSHTLAVQNTSGCISPVTNITVNAQPATPAAPTVSVVQPTCMVATGTITVTSSTTGLTFSLDGGIYASYPSGGYTVPSGSHTLIAQNASGCISVITGITINTQPSLPIVSASAGVITCFGTTTTLTATASGGTSPFEYSLDGGDFQSDNNFIVGGGTHTIVVRNAELCTAFENVTITQPTAISATASASANTIDCNGGITTLLVSANGGTGSLQYSLNGGIFQAGNNFNIGAGNYTVTVKDANNCTVVTPVVTITQPATLIASAFAKRITQCGGTTVITVTASGGVTPYTSGVGNFIRGPGTWSFAVIDARGCTDTTDIVIEAPGCVDLKIYPNPTKNSIIVNHSIAEPGSVMQVFSINGALLLTKAVPQNAFQTTIDVSRLAAASYVLVYLNGNDKKEILFVKVSSQ